MPAYRSITTPDSDEPTLFAAPKILPGGYQQDYKTKASDQSMGDAEKACVRNRCNERDYREEQNSQPPICKLTSIAHVTQRGEDTG